MRKLVTSVAATAVVVAGGVGAWLALRDQPHASTAVHTAAVSRGDLTVTASAAGSIVAVNQRALSFGTSGTVSKLNVKAGDEVTAGDILARLNDSDAQNAVAAAQQALDAAKSNLALAQQQADEAAQAAAAPSPSATGRPGGAGGSGGTAGGGSTHNTSSGTDNLLRAQQSVNNAELTLEQDEAKLGGTTIVAPVAGRILSVSGAVGSSVSAGGSGFMLMAGAGDVAVQAEFSEADVAAIKIGEKARVTLANHPGKSYPATVTQIDPAGTASGQLVRFGVELTFTSVPAGLLLGQSANVAVTTASATDVLYVPAAAVTTGADGKPQVMVRVGSTEQARPVTVGLEADQGVQIMSGLDAGQTVVVG
jgi:HlyD family secretion protein